MQKLRWRSYQIPATQCIPSCYVHRLQGIASAATQSAVAPCFQAKSHPVHYLGRSHEHGRSALLREFEDSKKWRSASSHKCEYNFASCVKTICHGVRQPIARGYCASTHPPSPQHPLSCTLHRPAEFPCGAQSRTAAPRPRDPPDLAGLCLE